MQFCCSPHKFMFLTNAATFKMEINRLPNNIRFNKISCQGELLQQIKIIPNTNFRTSCSVQLDQQAGRVSEWCLLQRLWRMKTLPNVESALWRILRVVCYVFHFMRILSLHSQLWRSRTFPDFTRSKDVLDIHSNVSVRTHRKRWKLSIILLIVTVSNGNFSTVNSQFRLATFLKYCSHFVPKLVTGV